MSRLAPLPLDGEVPTLSLQTEKEKCLVILEDIRDASRRVNIANNRARKLNKKVDDLCLDFGRSLLAMRRRVEAGEAGGTTWWQWLAGNFPDIARKRAEHWLGIAAAEDPETAAVEHRKRDAERSHAYRERQKQLAAPCDDDDRHRGNSAAPRPHQGLPSKPAEADRR